MLCIKTSRFAVRTIGLPVLVNVRGFAQRTIDPSLTEDDVKEARLWLAKLDAETIPENICDFSYSRSSGPGGQNVNKFSDALSYMTTFPPGQWLTLNSRINSKATMRVPLSSLKPIIPKLIWPSIVNSRYCAERSGQLVIHSDRERKQHDNARDCLSKLTMLIQQAGKDTVPGETSEAQKSRVKSLQRASNEARIRDKKFRSSQKNARRNSGRGDE